MYMICRTAHPLAKSASNIQSERAQRSVAAKTSSDTHIEDVHKVRVVTTRTCTNVLEVNDTPPQLRAVPADGEKDMRVR